VDARHLLFSLLTQASTGVVVELANEIDKSIRNISAKHFDALREAIVEFRAATMSRELVLQDALRLNRVKLSPRALWLVRPVSTEASIVWIDKRLSSSPDELLAASVSDLRGLVRAADGKRVFKFEKFKGLRSGLPLGGWASNVKIGSLSSALAEQVLAHPHEWPGDLVQHAVENVEERLLSSLENVAWVAGRENWFPRVEGG
jgi:hypothetical protein